MMDWIRGSDDLGKSHENKGLLRACGRRVRKTVEGVLPLCSAVGRSILFDKAWERG